METTTETTAKVVNYREKILIALDESVRLGDRDEFNYIGIDGKHKDMRKSERIREMVEIKKKLFLNLDEKSYTFGRILSVAKIAVRKMQDDGEYGYYCAELIMKFVELEEVFGERKLKSVGVRDIEPEPSKKENNSYPMKVKEEKVLSEVKEGDVYIGKKVTGERLVSMIKKKEQAKEELAALNDFDWDAEADEPEEDIEMEHEDGELDDVLGGDFE